MTTKRTPTRSESARRTRRSTAQPARPAARKPRATGRSSNRNLPPISARGVINDFGIERHKKSGKRRYSSAFTMSNPLLNVLPMPVTRRERIRPGWRLVSFTLLLLLGVGLYLFLSLPVFSVSAAHVTGNQRITADEINAALGLNGRSIFLLNADRIQEQALQAYPELASVEVKVDLPNVVTVNVTERQPIIQWQQDGGYAWIDETGTAFRPHGEAQNLIIVQALAAPPVLDPSLENSLNPSPYISAETVKALVALAPYVPVGTPILYDPATGLSWTDARGWQAVFGLNSKDVEVRVRVYQALVDSLTQRGIRPTLINVAYPSAPFYRAPQVETQAENQ